MVSLKEILRTTRKEIEKRKLNLPLEKLKARFKNPPPIRSLQKALVNSKGIALIGEVKKASPSAGLIRKEFFPENLAQCYEKNGAVAISVLTEEKFFKGNLSYLSKIREKVNVPILRKDFILDEYQIWESRCFGADVILLIVSILNNEEIKRFSRISQALQMEILLEIHSQEEWRRISGLPGKLIGINNRDLKNLEIDLHTTFKLVPLIPKDRIIISESGIKNREDVLDLEKAGIKGILVGETIMKSDDIAKKIRGLLGK